MRSLVLRRLAQSIVVILVVAIILEAFSFRTAILESLKVKDPQVGWWTFIRRSKNPELPVVLLSRDPIVIAADPSEGTS